MTAIVIAAPTASAKFLFSTAVPGAQDAAMISFQQMLGQELAAASEPANTGVARATRASTYSAWEELSATSPDSAWPDVLALLLSLRAGMPSPAPAVPASASILQDAAIAIPSNQQLHGIGRGPTDAPVLPGPPVKPPAAPASDLAAPPSHAPRDGTADERQITDAVSLSSASTELPDAHARHPTTSALPAGAIAATASAPTGAASAASVSHLIAPSFSHTGWDVRSAASLDDAWPDALSLRPALRAGMPSPAPAVPASASILQDAAIAIPSNQQLHGIGRGPTDAPVLPGPPVKPPAAPASDLAAPPSHAPRDGTADERQITDAVSLSSASTELPDAHARHPTTSALPAGAIAATASAPTGAASAASVSHLIAPSFSHTGWDEAISQRVLWMARGGIQSASLLLNPPQLGPVQVTLQIENQQASVQFVAASPQVQQSLQDALPVLRDMLGQAGIVLGQADVGSQPQQQRNPVTASANPFMAAADKANGPAQRSGKAVSLKSLPVRRGLINLYA